MALVSATSGLWPPDCDWVCWPVVGVGDAEASAAASAASWASSRVCSAAVTESADAVWFCSAIRTARSAAAGSTFAIAAPFATTWPTFTRTEVTVPEVSNCGEAVCGLASVPLELTLAVTSPRLTVVDGRVVLAASESLLKNRR